MANPVEVRPALGSTPVVPDMQNVVRPAGVQVAEVMKPVGQVVERPVGQQPKVETPVMGATRIAPAAQEQTPRPVNK